MKWYIEQREYPLGKIPVKWRDEAMQQIKLNKMEKSLHKSETALTWTPVGPNNIGGRVRAIAVHPLNPDIVYLGSVSGGVWKSTNGGGSWTALKDDMENLAVCSILIDPNDPNTIYAGTGEGFFNIDAIRGEGIFKSTDAGANWVRLASTNNSNFYYVNKLIYDASTNVLWAATRKGLFRSSDGGDSFTGALTGKGNDVHCTDIEIASTSPTTIYASFGLFNVANIYRSTDGGTTFSSASILTRPGQGRIEMAASPSNPQVVYVSFFDLNTNGVSVMVKTTNGGNNWDSIAVAGPAFSGSNNYAGSQAWYDNIMSVDPDNANNVVIGGLDIWKTTDGGASWKQKTNWYQQTGYQYVHADQHALAFAPSNSNILYNGNDGGIYRSTDKGETWTSKNNNLAITQFYYGAVSPSGTNYYGGTQDNGTIASTGSTSWQEIIGGDGGVTEVDNSHPNNIYGEYVNFAFFKSTNGGSSFSKKMNGIPTGTGHYDGTKDRTLFITPYSIDPNNSSTLVAGTYRVWKTTDGANSWNTISGDLTGSGSGSNGAKISTVIIAKGNSNVIYTGCSNGVIKVTTDGGTVWDSSKGLPNAYCTRIASDPINPATAYASFSGFSAGNKIFKTTNYGQTWSNISSNLPNIPVNCVLINPENTNNIYLGTDLGVFSTEDGGGNWTLDNNGLATVSVQDLDYRASDKRLFASSHGRGMFYATLSNSLTQTTLLQENFDLPQFPPNGWDKVINNTNSTWLLGNITDLNFSSIDPANVNSAVCEYSNSDQDELLITPSFSLGNGAASIEFHIAYNSQYLTNNAIYLGISTDNGNSWPKQLWHATNDGQGLIWRFQSIDLSAYKNMSNLKLAWEYYGSNGDVAAIDNVKIIGYQSTDAVNDIAGNVPKDFELYQNYPNPFNPTTTIKYSIAPPNLPFQRNPYGKREALVQLKIYDILGNEVATLVNEDNPAGSYEVTWNGTNNSGQKVASGTYIYRIMAGNFVESKKMILLK